jgi:hypothetical protein
MQILMCNAIAPTLWELQRDANVQWATNRSHHQQEMRYVRFRRRVGCKVGNAGASSMIWLTHARPPPKQPTRS